MIKFKLVKLSNGDDSTGLIILKLDNLNYYEAQILDPSYFLELNENEISDKINSVQNKMIDKLVNDLLNLKKES